MYDYFFKCLHQCLHWRGFCTCWFSSSFISENMVFSSSMVVCSCPILPPWKSVDDTSFILARRRHTVSLTRFSPSSCRRSSWSTVQSCKVATLSIVSSITSFKSVSSPLESDRGQEFLLACNGFTSQPRHLYSDGRVIHLSAWLQGP